MKYCTHCGNELLDEAVVCPKCGCPTELYEKKKTEEPKKTSNSSLKTAADVLIIFGCVLTGLLTYYVYFIGFAWTIPLTIIYFIKCSKGEQISTGFKVCLLILVSQLGGIFLLCDKEQQKGE